MAVCPGEALNIVKYKLHLKQPMRISATNLRKHTATISQVIKETHKFTVKSF